jgi:outer membrane protein assembly factor BamE
MTAFLPIRRNPLGLLVLLASLVLAGCSSFDSASKKVTGVVSPYSIDIVQGNVVTREQIAAVQLGMPRLQVQSILGASLLVSVFHAQRWDYVFTFTRQGQAPQSRRVTLFFKDDRLDKMEADDLPSEAEFVRGLSSKATAGKPLPLEATPEKLNKYPAPKAAVPVSPTVGLPGPSSYPPLEPAAK